MQLLILALCIGSLCMGAASDLRGAVRSGVDSCTCNFAGGGLTWPDSTCYCNKACSETCCYFSQPQQFDQPMSACMCEGEEPSIILGIYTSCDHQVKEDAYNWFLVEKSQIGNNFWAFQTYEQQYATGFPAYWDWVVPQSWYTSYSPALCNPALSACAPSPPPSPPPSKYIPDPVFIIVDEEVAKINF